MLDNGIGLINSAYGVYARDIRKKRSVGDFLADIVLLGGDTATGIVNGERALHVLGVALTGASGSRKAYNLNFYDEKTTNVLIKQMNASRASVLSEIQQKKDRPGNSESAGYSFDIAADDLVRYFEAGTLNQAFVDLDTQTALTAENNRRGILKLNKVTDVQAILPSTTKETLFEINSKLQELQPLVSLDPRITSNAAKISSSTAFLKVVYDKIAADSDFAPIIATLQAVPATPPDPHMTPPRQAALVKATGKLMAVPPQPLNGEDYFALVRETLRLTFTDPVLYAKLLKYFNEANVEVTP